MRCSTLARVHHGDAGAVIVRDHVGHLAQQEHRQAALAQNRGDLHLRVNAVAHVDAMVVVVVNTAGRGIHADVIAVFLNGIQQVLQVHAAPAEGDDAGHDRHAAHQMTDLELFLKIKVVDGRRDVEGLTRIAFHVVGHGAGLVDDQQALAGCSGVIPDMVTLHPPASF